MKIIEGRVKRHSRGFEGTSGFRLETGTKVSNMVFRRQSATRLIREADKQIKDSRNAHHKFEVTRDAALTFRQLADESRGRRTGKLWIYGLSTLIALCLGTPIGISALFIVLSVGTIRIGTEVGRYISLNAAEKRYLNKEQHARQEDYIKALYARRDSARPDSYAGRR